MDNASIFVDDSSGDESIVVHHGLSLTPRKNVVIDSSDDEDTPNSKAKNSMHNAMHVDIDSSNDNDDSPFGRSANDDDDLTEKMNNLTMDSEDSAWVYDKNKREFHLASSQSSTTTSSMFEVVDDPWPELSLPVKLFESLYPHQKVGVQWAASMHINKIGGIL